MTFVLKGPPVVAFWAGGRHECDFLVLLSSDCQLILYPARRSNQNELLDLKLQKLREIIAPLRLLLSPVQTIHASCVTDLLSQRMSVPLLHTRFPTLKDFYLSKARVLWSLLPLALLLKHEAETLCKYLKSTDEAEACVIAGKTKTVSRRTSLPRKQHDT